MSAKSQSTSPRARSYDLYFFIAVILYSELLIQILTGWTLTAARLCIVVLFSACYGAALAAIALLLGFWRGKRAVMCILLFLIGLLFSTQYFLFLSFRTYMTLSSILSGGGNVAAEFKGIVFSLIFHRFWAIALFLLPTLLYALFGKKCSPFHRKTILHGAVCLVLAAVFFFLASALVGISRDKLRYKEEYTFNAACQSFGILTGCRLELANSDSSDYTFQTVTPDENDPSESVSEPPAPTQPVMNDPEPDTTEDTHSGEEKEEDDDESEEPDPQNEPVEEPQKTTNSLDIDFSALAETEPDATVASLHSYVSSLHPDKINQYTGLFAGKNLIFISAESFSKEVIDPKLTPTLYRLANKGIIFDDYYQPAWGGSTSTGEYANLIGLIPTDGVRSIQDTIGHNMYFTLGNQLQRLGYYSAAFHDGTYQYYDRDKTHCNLGYSSWMALGNGMEQGVQETWPESDLEMIDFTVPSFIDKQPFSIYYMTVSGHGNYLSGNDMADKNYDKVKDLDRPEAIKRYLAANLELEYAMRSLLKQLNDAGIADDTVIVLGTDHYPYGLEKSETWGNTENYLEDLYGFEPNLNPEQDHSALIIWSGCLEKMGKIEVSTPVYSLDLVPTLSNLFGLDYDSRLLVGRDVFSYQQPLVIWPDYSWLTDKGYYSTSRSTFIPNEGVDVTSAYVERIKAIVANKFTFSKGVLNTDYYRILFGEDDIE